MIPVDDLHEWLKDPKTLNLIAELYQEKSIKDYTTNNSYIISKPTNNSYTTSKPTNNSYIISKPTNNSYIISKPTKQKLKRQDKPSNKFDSVSQSEQLEFPSYILWFILVIPIYFIITCIMFYINIQDDIKIMLYGLWFIFSLLFWLEFPSFLNDIKITFDETDFSKQTIIIMYFLSYSPWLYWYRIVPCYYFLITGQLPKFHKNGKMNN